MPLLPRKVLITGATGLLGSSLYPYLKDKGCRAIGCGFGQKADFNCNMSSQTETEQMLDKVRPDCIINLAALTNVDRCEEEPHQAYLLNVKIVENIAGWIKKNPQTRLVQISTDQIYDGQGPHKEEDIKIVNTYGLSKYCGELAARQVKSTILRTNFFGKSKSPDKKSFSDWLIECFKNQTPIKLFTDVLFSPLSIETLQEIIAEVIKNPAEGVYNLGSKEGLSKRDFAIMLAKRLLLDTNCAKDASSKDVNLKAARPGDMRMDCGKFEKTFKIKLPALADEIDRIL